jgi:fumarate hydratase class II
MASIMTVNLLAVYTAFAVQAAKIAKRIHRGGLTLRQAALASGYLTAEQFDDWVRPGRMMG